MAFFDPSTKLKVNLFSGVITGFAHGSTTALGRVDNLKRNITVKCDQLRHRGELDGDPIGPGLACFYYTMI